MTSPSKTIHNAKTPQKDILLLGMFYIVAHGGILLIPNAIFWDDWVLYRTTPSVILDTFRQAGSMFNLVGHLHVAMLAIGPWIYKVLTFILMFASGFLLNQILNRHTLLTAETRLFVVLLFLVLPFNAARMALIDFPYTLCYFLFFAAWLLMDSHRFVALIFFFLSFNTNSLLVFYALPILDMMYRGGYLTSLRSSLNFCIRKIDYIFLPFVFFFIKVYFFSPSGFYENYNISYSFENLISSPKAQFDDLLKTRVNTVLSLFLLPFVIFGIKNKFSVAKDDQRISWGLLITIGSFAFFLGAFPYWILGHVPTFQEWTTRHQLLLPLGAALFIVGGLSLLGTRMKIGVMSLVIASSLAFNLTTYAKLSVDWNKQVELIQLFSRNMKIQHAGLLIFDDRTMHLNALGRHYRRYEWHGLLENAFGDEKRYCITRDELDRYLSGGFDYAFSSHYKAGSHRRDAALPVVLVEIDLAESEKKGWYEKFLNSVFPKFTLSVSEVDVKRF